MGDLTVRRHQCLALTLDGCHGARSAGASIGQDVYPLPYPSFPAPSRRGTRPNKQIRCPSRQTPIESSRFFSAVP
ncbi:hypothetical protein EVAR_44399_1 [Eumeta japonica]|uniref:Uncharacterized protein n=1 Tax=Eumeta variegata TaxID=151549 RepID=A0A4C1XT86_EUMVA|nr:hypothetical protein EVAR_44399_1 [Eumeta japonica]